jgi:MFS family permease
LAATKRDAALDEGGVRGVTPALADTRQQADSAVFPGARAVPQTNGAESRAVAATSEGHAEKKKVDTFGALVRHRNFRLYWSGALVSNIGTWMQTVAQAWLVYQLTGSAALLGAVSFLQAAPAIVLSLVGGVLADRVERRMLMLCTQTVAMWLACILSFLTFTHTVRIHHVMVIAFCAGIVNALNTPVRQGIISDLVPKADIQNAVAINSAQFQASRLLGPAFAGMVLATFGPAWCFLLNGLSFLAVIISLCLLELPPRKGGRAQGSILAQAAEGIAYVAKDPTMGTLVLIAAVPAFFGMPYMTLMPIFAENILHIGPKGLGLLMSATGLGSLVGALTVASLTGFRGRGKLQLACAALFGIMLLCFGLSHVVIVSLLLLVVGGAASMTFSSLNQTFIQTLAPDAMRGRVLSVLTLTTFGVMPLGNLTGGFVAQRFGAPVVLIGGGMVCACFASFLVLSRSKVLALQ